MPNNGLNSSLIRHACHVLPPGTLYPQDGPGRDPADSRSFIPGAPEVYAVSSWPCGGGPGCILFPGKEISVQPVKWLFAVMLTDILIIMGSAVFECNENAEISRFTLYVIITAAVPAAWVRNASSGFPGHFTRKERNESDPPDYVTGHSADDFSAVLNAPVPDSIQYLVE